VVFPLPLLIYLYPFVMDVNSKKNQTQVKKLNK